MAGIHWSKFFCSQDYLVKTNIPPNCWLYDGRYHKPYGWYAAYPYCIGSRDYSGLAHYRERVGRECGSGAYFNAFRTVVSFSDREARYLDEQDHAYLTKGKFYWLGGEWGSVAILDGASLLEVGFHVEWDGDLVRADSWTWWPIRATRHVIDEYTEPGTWYNCAEFSKEVPVSSGMSLPWMSPESLVDTIYSNFLSGENSSPWRLSLPQHVDGSAAPLPKLDNNPNLFNWRDKEYWSFRWITDVGVVLPPYASMVSQAYTEAIASFPAVHANVLANILDVISLAKSLLSGNLGKVLKKSNGEKMRDAWLAYRYSYTTTKLDYEELTSFVKRIDSLPQGDITLRSTVHFSHTTVRCSVVLPMGDILGELGSIGNLGLKLSATNAWDLIPFSFVVDWFLRISDWLDYFETQGFSLTLHPKEVWYSIRTKYEGQTTYFRWQGVPALGLPFDLYTAVSNKTALMRIGDSIALFT